MPPKEWNDFFKIKIETNQVYFKRLHNISEKENYV